MADLARRETGSPAVQPVWIGVGVPPDFFWVGSSWVNGFVDKARWRHLETQRHQEMLVAEGVKQSDLADRFREQLHRDSVGFEALHILGQVVKIEADVSRLSRNASVLQSDAVCGAVVLGFD